MIAEKLEGHTVDIEPILKFYHDMIKPLPPVMQQVFGTEDHGGFGGWSILSSSGKYTDGWTQANGHVNPTEICVGPIHDLMMQVFEMGLNPCRARVTVLHAGCESTWHRDAPDGEYNVRLHVPLITNDQCRFITDEGEYHMPADGSMYLVHINRMHKVVNYSDIDRIHIIMGVIDRTGVSKYHVYDPYNLRGKSMPTLRIKTYVSETDPDYYTKMFSLSSLIHMTRFVDASVMDARNKLRTEFRNDGRVLDGTFSYSFADKAYIGIIVFGDDDSKTAWLNAPENKAWWDALKMNGYIQEFTEE